MVRSSLPTFNGCTLLIKDAYTKWFDAATITNEVMVVEDFDARSIENISINVIKLWGDKYGFQAEYKGGSAFISPLLVIFTSNYTLDELLSPFDNAMQDAVKRRVILNRELTQDA